MTSLEFAILQAIDTSEYGEFLVDVVWTFSLWDNVDRAVVKSQRSIGGIVASLRKKGLVTIGGSGTQDDPQTIAMTEEGICQYLARHAANNTKPKKTVSYAVEQKQQPIIPEGAVRMPRTVSAFLKSEAFEKAVDFTGNTTREGYSADTDGRVAYDMSGGYTVDEVRAILRDLEHVQAAYDSWVPPLTISNV